MRWFTFYNLETKRDMHLNLNTVQWWRLEEWDLEDDNGPVKVWFATIDGNEWCHVMSNKDYERLDRAVLPYEQDPEHQMMAVAS